MPPAQEKRN